MALGDWVINTTANFATSLEISTPLVGNGSLRQAFGPQVAAGHGANLHLTGSFARGFTKGRIRTLLRVRTRPASTNDVNTGAGIICMQSALNVTASGSCYFAGWGHNEAATGDNTRRFYILKVDGGLSDTSVSASQYLADSSTVTTTDGDYYPLEFEWQVDIPNLGGVRLILRRGTLNSTDFGTLATVYDIIDSTSPLTTTVAEGVGSIRGNTTTSGADFVFNWDETSVFQLL